MSSSLCSCTYNGPAGVRLSAVATPPRPSSATAQAEAQGRYPQSAPMVRTLACRPWLSSSLPVTAEREAQQARLGASTAVQAWRLAPAATRGA